MKNKIQSVVFAASFLMILLSGCGTQKINHKEVINSGTLGGNPNTEMYTVLAAVSDSFAENKVKLELCTSDLTADTGSQTSNYAPIVVKLLEKDNLQNFDFSKIFAGTLELLKHRFEEGHYKVLTFTLASKCKNSSGFSAQLTNQSGSFKLSNEGLKLSLYSQGEDGFVPNRELAVTFRDDFSFDDFNAVKSEDDFLSVFKKNQLRLKKLYPSI